MLPEQQIKDRLHALRLLRGLSQKDFAELCAAQGLGTTEAGRVERGKLPFTGKHQLVFARVLDVPEDWFNDPDVSRLLWAADSGRTAATRFAEAARLKAQQQAGHPDGDKSSSPGRGGSDARPASPDRKHPR